MQIKEPPPPGTGVENAPPPPTAFDLFWTSGGAVLVPFLFLVLIYVVLLRATAGSKHRRVVVPLVMVPLVLYVLWGFRWMFWG
jgi:hypothetical protein